MAAVVAGVDGSVPSVAAAHWAAAEAARRGTGLLLVSGCYHLGRMPESGEDYRETEARTRLMLASVAAEETDRFPEVDVRFEAVPEWPVGALLAAQQEAELLVVGSRGLGGFRGLMLGSTSRGLAAEASCPVVVVRQDGQTSGHLHALSEEPPPVVVGVDVRDPDPAVLEFARRAAEDRGAALYAVAVAPWRPSPRFSPHSADERRRAELVDHEERALEELLGPLRTTGSVGIVGLVRVGHPAALLVEEAHDAALLVLGRHGSGHTGSDTLGPVTHAVLHHAMSPVAVVPFG